MSIQELEQIAEQVQKCKKCPLYEKATQGVSGEGSPDADIVFVGEGPGAEEDKQGRPFVGAAGKFLDEMIGLVGWKREDVFIGNIIKHRPPDNRDPLPDEVDACFPYLEAQIKAINPKLIVTLGRHSMNQFLPGSFKISKEHGKVFRRKGNYYVPLYHPAAALYHNALKQTLIDDFKKLPKMLEKVKTMNANEIEIEEPPEEVASAKLF